MSEQALTIWKAQTETTKAVDRLWSYLPSIAAPGYNLDSFSARLAIQVMKQPNIPLAKPETVINCLAEIAELGLVLGSECNLVVYGQDPKKMECTNLIEYQGWMRKFREIPGVDDIVTEVVYSNDHFKYDRVNRKIEHDVDEMNPNRGHLTHAYAIIYWLDPRKRPNIEVLDKKTVDRHRARARQGGNTPAWTNNEPEMWRKSAMQAIARRYGRSLSGVIGSMAVTDEHAEYIEYQNTPGSQERMAEIMADHPEWAEPDERPMAQQNVTTVPQQPPRFVDVNPETGEMDEPETEPEAEPMVHPVHSEPSEVALMTIRQWLQPRLNEMSPKQRAAMIRSCGGGDATLANITSLDVLTKLEQMIVTREKGKPQETGNDTEPKML